MSKDKVWAICCSGGGIRSASYCLGALQSLEEAELLKNARLIVGVSGGSYTVASRALVAHGLERDGGHRQPPPYAPGSPEEEHLRDNSRYLAPDAKTLLAGVLSLLFGAAVTLLLVLTPVFAAAHAWGWLLRWHGVLTPAASRTQAWTVTLTGTTWWIWPAIATALTFIIFLWWWATLIPNPRGQERHSGIAVESLGWAAFLTLVLSLAVFAVPALVAWLTSSSSGALKTVLDDLGFGAGTSWTPAALAGFVAAVIAVSQSAQRLLVSSKLLTPTSTGQGASPQQTGLTSTVSGLLRGLLLPWMASVLVVLAFAVAGLRWVQDGAAAGFTRGQLWQVTGAVVLMLVMRFLCDVNRISLHDFYRWRLATAFAVTRDGSPRSFGTKSVPGALLSELAGQRPQPVLCATANIDAHREVPPGRGGLSLVFDAEYVTLRGADPSQTVRARTADYEALVGARRFTLFDVSAISGAALSPLMGSATQQALRILFTVTGLRLGVWLPHPALVAVARQELDRQRKPGVRADHWWHAVWLLLWYMLPHVFWESRKEQKERREARLWAYVLRLRGDSERRSRKLLGGLLYHALQPTLGLLYAEAAGQTSYRSTWICVTDGGHYDNLGLVEALQRAPELGITHIMVLDASGDKANTWFTLGGAIALARSDAGTQIAIDPTTMITPAAGEKLALGSGQVVKPWARGTFTCQEPRHAGTITVCKLGWWTGAPWDVRAYAAGHASYPTDSTMDQLYDSAEFDAYRELGFASAKLAIREIRRDFTEPFPTRLGLAELQYVDGLGEFSRA